jgi:hypothetical protein
MPIMPSDEPHELRAAFARYRAAQTALRGLRKPALEEVEAALQARVELFRCLVESGWEAPERLAKQIGVDAALVDEPLGAAGG